MVLHYKCPNCGADMGFDSQLEMLSCHSCGRQDNIATFPKEWIISEFNPEETSQYHCKNCGAILITDGDTVATTCSFCGAGVVLADRVTGELAPAMVIPFAISKEEAQIAFRKWCKGGVLTPRGFMNADRIKNITGMYVPFWLYNINSNAVVNALATTKRTYSRGDYIYTETRHYKVDRHVNIDYIKVPVDASEKMNDDLMDKLEPYDYSKLRDFNTPYLAGYIAEKYNYTSDDLLPRVKERIRRYSKAFVNSTIVGYSTVTNTYEKIDMENKAAYYALLPVWMVCYDYRQSEHIFAMNGQTGKIVGKPPLSWAKIASWFAGISLGSFISLKLIGLLMGGILW